MPGVKRKVSTTSFNEVLQSNLGIVPAGGNKRVKKVTRKEVRRAVVSLLSQTNSSVLIYLLLLLRKEELSG